MAILRIFISSTYYDLKHVRNELGDFIKGLGYDAVMHDKGKVTYRQNETLENSCYNPDFDEHKGTEVLCTIKQDLPGWCQT